MLRGSKTDEIMTIVFMILAVIAVVCLFFISERIYFLVFGSTALGLRVVQYILRFLK